MYEPPIDNMTLQDQEDWENRQKIPMSKLDELIEHLSEMVTDPKECTPGLERAGMIAANILRKCYAAGFVTDDGEVREAYPVQTVDGVAVYPGMNASMKEGLLPMDVGILSIAYNDRHHPDDVPEGQRFILVVRDGDGDDHERFIGNCYSTRAAAEQAKGGVAVSEQTKERATCRWCKRELDGVAYCYGGLAYHPETEEQCKVNHYGGYVCSYMCDFNASLELEQSMPGHGPKQRTLGSGAAERLRRNWP